VSATDAARIGESMLRADSQSLSAAQALSPEEARRDIQILITRALGIELAGLLAHPERIPEARQSQRYQDMLARRLRGEPVAYILGEREFHGLSFEVGDAVLIPRPETETLVELALELIPERAERRVLDLGTGSGCIAITLARHRREIRVIAVDASRAALAVAAHNIARHATFNVELRAGSWFAPVAGESFDVIVSNPPYIADGDKHLREGDVRFEPVAALVSGDDGLHALRTIVAGAAGHLQPGGWLAVEHGFDQADTVAGLLRAAGFADLIARSDLAGIPRVAAGRFLAGSP
jgi:release factor glutamine methyltransferase